MVHERWNSDKSQDRLTRVHFAAPMWLGVWQCIPLTQDHINNYVVEWGDPENEKVRIRFTVDYVEASLTDKGIAANMEIEAVERLRIMSNKAKPMNIELKDLVGTHVLDTAAIMSSLPPKDAWSEERDCVSFGMDGKTYTAIEDPDDGYRSYLDKLQVEDGHSEALKGAVVVGRKVIATHEDSAPTDDWEDGRDLLTITDAETGHVWLVIGTKNTDDYYPFCVLEWNAMKPLT